MDLESLSRMVKDVLWLITVNPDSRKCSENFQLFTFLVKKVLLVFFSFFHFYFSCQLEIVLKYIN